MFVFKIYNTCFHLPLEKQRKRPSPTLLNTCLTGSVEVSVRRCMVADSVLQRVPHSMCLQAYWIWTDVVQSPSFLQVDNRYILPNGRHLDTIIHQGETSPLQFLQFVQDTVGKKTWVDDEWEKLIPVHLWVDTVTGKTAKSE